MVWRHLEGITHVRPVDWHRPTATALGFDLSSIPDVTVPARARPYCLGRRRAPPLVRYIEPRTKKQEVLLSPDFRKALYYSAVTLSGYRDILLA
jgi:hypothetical protein